MAKTLHVIVEGRVQGVGFREFVRRAAARLHVTGWVRNSAGGAVEAMINGDAENVAALLREMRAGPPLSAVMDLRTEAADAAEAEAFVAFRVLRGA
ncbi:acylphosphatase [Rhodoblastus acidophilus]|uniref:Acylphosphatase n=1 Tax=Rhodoblastus acidophilus TaxID=1074 RepID=A0A6N8DJZ9_RHOAC|nr:acylphosphatase [Rhodoblastus acidophilus]MCW2273957.1 acylphosphatase [Rhodoblastus acidophilus]MTV30900.1 acylphosphatase [Rhodoblastus acidophilus]